MINIRSDRFGGRTIVLIFCPKFTGCVRDTLAAFRQNFPLFESAHAHLLAVTSDSAERAAQQDLPFTVLLHEAMHVTAGRRLVLLAFLFGDH
jgi:peroxiredoxin